MVSPSVRAFWLKHLHRWHWISAAVCLIGMILFAVTGITLNHSGRIEAKPQVSTRTGQLPEALLGALGGERSGELPDAIRDWISANMRISVDARPGEWSKDEVYVSLPRPGGDAWLNIDRTSGEIEYERTDRGWIAYFNDLHKGRNTGSGWSLFLDIFAVACLVFCITGLFLLQFHASRRPSTWPLVALGVVAPVLVLLLLVH